MQDSPSRDAFISQLETNFSVIASAGSGKTRAIVDRITSMARQDPLGKGYCSRLAVLTYTKKAASEMQARARTGLLNTGLDPSVLHKAFFGTIHSFCLSLIQSHGAYLGIPPSVEVLSSQEALWESFIQSLAAWPEGLAPDQLAGLSSFLKISDYVTLARDHPPEAFPVLPIAQLKPLHEPDLSALLSFQPDKRNAASVKLGQSLFLDWQKERVNNLGPSGFPSYTKGGKAFQELLLESFGSLKGSVSEYLCVFLRHLAESYRTFRLSQQKLSYEDLVYYAQKLLETEPVASTLQHKGYILLLDEAQDTDKAQFQLLLSLAGLWDVKKGCLTLDRVRKGAFCMVGDPQQSIYSQRASLSFYQDLHDTLTRSGALEELRFSTTMRCASAIVDAINTTFPSILNKAYLGQVDFVPLEAAPHKGKGRVTSWTVPHSPDEDQAIQTECTYIADRLAASDLQLKHYGELAILCPRRQWLLDIAEGLKAQHLPFQIHSSQSLLRDDPAYAWLTALFTVLERPNDAFELTGILRELYGVADADMARYVKTFYKKGALHPLNLIAPPPDSGPVFEALYSLTQLRLALKGCSVAQAFEIILKHTCLTDRLDSLPPSLRSSLGLKGLALEAYKADIQQYTLAEFAKALRQGLSTEAPEVPPLHNHIQLYTCHKSKGLEFAVVLLPFMGRKISRAPLEYPHLSTIGSQQALILDATQLRPQQKDDDYAYFEAELGRLLYVSFTRAKEELIVVHNPGYSSDNTPSFAQFLQGFRP